MNEDLYRKCPNDKTKLKLESIESSEEGHKGRTYICPKCGFKLIFEDCT